MAIAARGARRARGSLPLPVSFYDRETEAVSRDLLGAVLECRTPDGIVSGRIVETEAYIGEHDPACHAAAGHTERTRWLYGHPGTAYVYFIYGVHWCFNAVTRAAGHPSAVLVRAIEPIAGIDIMRRRRPAARNDRDLTNGPGKLCAALGVDGSYNGLRLDRFPLRIRAGEPVPDSEVMLSPRIGITKAADWPLRWYIAGNAWVSKTPRGFASRRLSE
jgi:DNA-3-methyladenine glycosylase